VVADRPIGHRPADGLLHPVAIGALIVLIVNDQLLKALWPSALTGKLSDVAGLIVAPLALQATWEVGQWLAGRWRGPSMTVLVAAIAIVGAGFAATQVWPAASEAYAVGLGLLQWPFRAIAAWLGGEPGVSAVPVVAVADAEDLLALPALLIPWWMGRARARRGS